MRKAIVSAVLAVGLVLGLAGTAFAHQAKSVTGSVDCAGNYSISGTADVWGGHYVQVNILGSEVARLQDNGNNTSIKPWGPVTGTTTAKPGDAISARTLNTNGSIEQGTAVTGVLSDGGGDCRTPVEVSAGVVKVGRCGAADRLVLPATPVGLDRSITGKLVGPGVVTVTYTAQQGYKLVGQGVFTFRLKDSAKCGPFIVPAHRAPRASLEGPCGDPFYRAVFDNRRSNKAVTFAFVYHRFGGGWSVIKRRVAAHKLVRSQYVHVLGFSKMAVTWWKGTLVSKNAAAPGNYRACV